MQMRENSFEEMVLSLDSSEASRVNKTMAVTMNRFCHVCKLILEVIQIEL